MFTIDEIQAAIDNANTCLYSIYKNYIEPRDIVIQFTKAKSYWAMITRSTCKPIGKQLDFMIKISSLFDDIIDSGLRKLRLEECMIHELIHTIPGCNNHGTKFKRLAYRIGCKYPQYKIETQTSGERFGLPEYEPKYRYEIVCKHCGKSFYRCKKLKKPLTEYLCGNCGSDNLEIKNI